MLGRTLCAQSNTGAVVGQVLDPQKALVPGASITITNVGTHETQTTKSNKDGTFSFEALPPATYTITIEKDGFDSVIVSDVTVSTAQTTSENVNLKVGLAMTTVQVTSTNSMVTPDSAMLSTTIDTHLLTNLPFNDRSSLASVLLVPGVQGDPQFPGAIQNENPGVYLTPVVPGASLAVAGGRPGSASILVDSADNTLTSFPRTGITFSGVTVQEITVQQNGLPAQYGRTGGGIINQTTRGGTSQFHGELSWLHEDPSTEAYTYGSPFRRGRHVNYFGASLGGPIMLPHYNGREHQAYFFVTVEPSRGTDENWGRSRFATPEELSGDFNDSLELLNTTILAQQGYTAAQAAPRVGSLYYQYNCMLGSNPLSTTNCLDGGFPTGSTLSSSKYIQIPGNNVSQQLAQNPTAKFVYGYFPTPQYPSHYVSFYNNAGTYAADGTNAYLVRGVEQFDDRFSIRGDKALTSRDFMMMRFTTVPVNGVRYSSFGPFSPVNTIPRDRISSMNAILGETHAFSSSVNEFHVTYTRADQHRSPPPPALTQDWGALIGLKPAALGAGFPSIGGFSNGNVGSGGTVLSNGRSLDVNLGVTDNYSFQRGLHTIKVGTDLRFLQQNRLDTSDLYGGDYGFSSGDTNNGSAGGVASASFVLGIVNSYSAKLAALPFYYRWRYYAGYVQDDWRIHSRITLNLGFRYNFETPRYEKYNHQGSFDASQIGTVNGQQAQGGFVFAGEDNRTRYLWPLNFKGYEPRIGIAYAPRPQFTIRASYSIVHPALTGLGTIVEPDLSEPQNGINVKTDGINAGHINYITDPVGAVPSHLPLSGGPLFTFTNLTNLPYVQQTNTVPYVQLYSFSLQYGLSRNSIVELAYSGQHAVHLFSVPIAVNTPTLGFLINAVQTGLNVTNSSYLNPYGVGSMNALQNASPYQQFYNNNIDSGFTRNGDSHYNGLYLTFRQRISRNITALASFSWSKSIDDGSSGSTDLSNPTDAFGLPQTQDPFGASRLERSYSTFDIPVKGTGAVSYTEPAILLNASGWKKIPKTLFNGWQATVNYLRESGYPLGVQEGTIGYWFSSIAPAGQAQNYCSSLPVKTACDYGNGGNAIVDMQIRPNFVPGVPLINKNWKSDPFDETGKGGFINAAAFTTPGSIGNPAFGNVPRTLGNLRNPPTQYFNARITKIFILRESPIVRLNIFTNVLNALNHPNFFAQNMALNSSYDGSGTTPSLQNTFNPTAAFGNMSQTNITPGREFQLGVRLIF